MDISGEYNTEKKYSAYNRDHRSWVYRTMVLIEGTRDLIEGTF